MGLMLNVGDKDDCVAFMGYRELPDGSKCYAETNHLIKRLGDIIIAVNGRSCVGKTFKEVIVSFLLVVFVHMMYKNLHSLPPSCSLISRNVRRLPTSGSCMKVVEWIVD